MSSSQLIDHDALAALREVMDEDFIQLIETFVSDSHAKINTMQRALAAGQSDELRRAAHSLKGSSSNIGASGLMNTCRQIEERAAASELRGLEHLLVDLQSEFSQVKQQLEIYC
ncbi:Hpt domain-containing protein [Gilvimarinus chinensis]|uniref:Hpt domain-containing protein n=1 Tax=Gilvimarinus chinensis TaxID=396005 RepID=UPI0003728044|nr:Hpt domain-containing protein [Gilvimarinus chinensis]